MHPYIMSNEIPQIYMLGFNLEGMIEVTINKFLYRKIVKELKDVGSVTKEIFLSISYKEVTDVVVLSFPLPIITYPNYPHKKLNWEELNATTEKLAIFFELMYLYINFEEVAKGNHCINKEHPQLLSINAGFSCNENRQYPLIEAHFSPKAKILLNDILPFMDFGNILNMTYEQYLFLTESCNSEYKKQMRLFQKSGGGNNYLSIILNGSVPIFTVPGSSTSLGSDPDKFAGDGILRSHNMDSSLQLITMILLLINFDHEVLEPLYLNNLK